MEYAVCRRCAPCEHIWEQFKVKSQKKVVKVAVTQKSADSKQFLTTNFIECA